MSHTSSSAKAAAIAYWARRQTHLAYLIPLLFSHGIAQAAADAGSAELAPIVVTGSHSKAAKLLKMPQALKDTPQSVSITTQKQMQEQNLRTLEDVMQQSAGVTVQPFQLLTTGYYARGFKIDSFSQDGVPVLMGNTGAPPQDMAMYEQVEILRGANGLLQGTGNPAATVNLVPKKPPHQFALSGSLSAGRWQHYGGDIDVGGPLNASKSWRGQAVISHNDQDFFYDVAKQKSTHFYAITEVDVGEQTTLNVGASQQRIRSVTNMAGIPFYSDGSDIGLPRHTYLDAAWDRFDWDTTRVFAGVEHQFDNDWRLQVNANHMKGDWALDYAGAMGAVDKETGKGMKLTGGAYEFENKQNSLDAYATGPFSLFGRQHELMLGGQYQRTETEQFSAPFLSDISVPVDPWHWNPHSIAKPEIGAYSSRGPTKTTQSGLYAMGRFSVTDPLKLIVGGRFSRWQQETASATAKLNNEFTPYAGLVYQLTPQWSAYVSYAEVFQPQTQMTWGGDILSPVKGKNHEAGLKGELFDGQLNVSAALYQIRQQNRAQQDPDHPCAGPVCYYVASGEVKSQGFEAEANGQINRDLSVSASYSYNSTKYVTDAKASGQPFAKFAPKHIARLWGNYTLPWHERRISVGLGLQAQSDFSVESGGVTLRQAGYTLVNARIGYQINKQLSAALNVNNVFDKHYYQSLSGPAWNNRYGEPLSAMLTLRAKY